MIDRWSEFIIQTVVRVVALVTVQVQTRKDVTLRKLTIRRRPLVDCQILNEIQVTLDPTTARSRQFSWVVTPKKQVPKISKKTIQCTAIFDIHYRVTGTLQWGVERTAPSQWARAEAEHATHRVYSVRVTASAARCRCPVHLRQGAAPRGKAPEGRGTRVQGADAQTR